MEHGQLKFNSKVIHGGQKPDKAYGAVMTPIYQTSTYAQSSPGQHGEYVYSRSANPTRKALENALASIENGTHAFAFASGMAAIDTVLKLLKPGDKVLAGSSIYGGSYRLFKQLYEPMGITFDFVEMHHAHGWEQHIDANTKLIWVETPTNSLMGIIDIAAIAKIAKKQQILFAVDNTFATPYLQKPLDFDADIVMHSATKYLAGHSDVVLGALVVKNEELAKRIAFVQNAVGAICGPMDSFLTLRGIKTLHVRMQRHCENGRAIADFLNKHPKIDQVYYPGLKTHDNHNIAQNQMNDFGGVMSIIAKGDNKGLAIDIIERLRLFTLAESLGGVESLVGHPVSMTHASVPKKEREKMGVSDGMVRLSVGIEDVSDLIEDLKQALG